MPIYSASKWAWISGAVVSAGALAVVISVALRTREPLPDSASGTMSSHGSSDDSAALARLTQRVAELEARRQVTEPRHADSQPQIWDASSFPVAHRSEAAAQGRPSIAETQQRMRNDESALVDRFTREGYDTTWAPGTSASIQNDVTKLAGDRKFSVQDVKCGTTVCLARLQWPDYASVKEEYRSLLTYPYSANCARSIFVPPPDDEATSYGATLIFDCEGARAGSN